MSAGFDFRFACHCTLHIATMTVVSEDRNVEKKTTSVTVTEFHNDSHFDCSDEMKLALGFCQGSGGTC